MQKIIAIDGPCGSGKSSIAKKLSTLLKITHIDTGAMYRALGYYFKNNNFDLSKLDQNKSAAILLLNDLKFEYISWPNFKLIINGEELTEIIRQPEVSSLASVISQYDFIRNYLTKFQRELAQNEICVMEGRDIGTVVFPDAVCKYYLTATESERANRRLYQYKLKKIEIDLETVLREIKSRDQKDMNREIAPLKKATDALLVDSTELNEIEVINKLEILIREKFKSQGLKL